MTTTRLSFNKFSATLAIALAALPLFALAADPSVCYGQASGTECLAPSLSVPSAALTTPPADFEVTTDRAVTLVVSLPAAQFVGTPTVAGGSVLSSAAQTIITSCAASCVLALPQVSGLAPGGDLHANVRLFDPNGATEVFFSGSVLLAHMEGGAIEPPTDPGAFTATAWAINPASNTEQRSFVRIVAPGDAATVAIYATDDNGRRSGPIFVTVPAGGAVQLTPADLERGNPAKGLFSGVGTGVGKWRLDFSSVTRFRAFALGTGLASLPVE